MTDQVHNLISAALAGGYVISVHDGEEWSTCRSTDAKAIYKDARGVDYATLRFRDGAHGKVRGWATIIWENRGEEISDYASNPAMNDLIDRLDDDERMFPRDHPEDAMDTDISGHPFSGRISAGDY